MWGKGRREGKERDRTGKESSIINIYINGFRAVIYTLASGGLTVGL